MSTKTGVNHPCNSLRGYWHCSGNTQRWCGGLWLRGFQRVFGATARAKEQKSRRHPDWPGRAGVLRIEPDGRSRSVGLSSLTRKPVSRAGSGPKQPLRWYQVGVTPIAISAKLNSSVVMSVSASADEVNGLLDAASINHKAARRERLPPRDGERLGTSARPSALADSAAQCLVFCEVPAIAV